jgi:hypothetical protein
MAADERVLKLKAIADRDTPHDGIVHIPFEYAKHSKMLDNLIEDLGDSVCELAPIEIACSYETVIVCAEYCIELARNNGNHAKFEDAHMTNIHAKLFDTLEWEKAFIGRYKLINNEPIDVSQIAEYGIMPADKSSPYEMYRKYIPDEIREEIMEISRRDESKIVCLKEISQAAQYLQIEPLVMLVGWQCMEIIKKANVKYNNGADTNLYLYNCARHNTANLLRQPLADRVLDEKTFNEITASLNWVERVYKGTIDPPMPDDSAIHAELYTRMPDLPLIPTIDDVDVPGTITPMKLKTFRV